MFSIILFVTHEDQTREKAKSPSSKVYFIAMLGKEIYGNTYIYIERERDLKKIVGIRCSIGFTQLGQPTQRE